MQQDARDIRRAHLLGGDAAQLGDCARDVAAGAQILRVLQELGGGGSGGGGGDEESENEEDERERGWSHSDGAQWLKQWRQQRAGKAGAERGGRGVRVCLDRINRLAALSAA
jgi:hypothetical protein